jgi:prepilin-type N-terminal cleavage/methylation domain-containing protein
MRRGFTLLEVIIALALIVLLLAGVFSFQWTLADSRSRLLEDVRESQAVEGMMERLENDLLSAIAGDAGLGAGVVGDAGSISVLSRGVWLAGPEEARRWSTDSSGPTGSPIGKATPGDLMGCRYRFVKDDAAATARLTVSRWLVEAGLDAPAEEALVTDRAELVRLRYFDGGAWRDSFSSLEAGGLPAAVEVAVWMRRQGATAGDGNPPLPQRAPDRVRVIAVPDGGVAP